MKTQQNPFNFLNKLHNDMRINEVYDKEMQRLKENRIRYCSFVKEREKQILENKKKRNSND